MSGLPPKASQFVVDLRALGVGFAQMTPLQLVPLAPELLDWAIFDSHIAPR